MRELSQRDPRTTLRASLWEDLDYAESRDLPSGTGDQLDGPGGQFPLIISPGQANPEYRPYTMTDMAALSDKLPPLSQGGAVWIRKLLSLTAGTHLAMGDIRALITSSSSAEHLRQVENTAHTNTVPHEAALAAVSVHIFTALRTVFPPVVQALPTFPSVTSSTSPDKVYQDCLDLWIDCTGKHPDREVHSQTVFRTLLVDSLSAFGG